jgi:DAACS family dicarboxylate/amino acid:cation (Na+ or H+) symporter
MDHQATPDVQRMKPHSKMLLALLVGAALGVAGNHWLGAGDPIVDRVNHYVAGPVGQIFLRLLFMLVVPLVFASIASGVAQVGDLRRLGRIGTKAMMFFLGSTIVAAALGLLAVTLVRPGERMPPETRAELMATYASDASSTVRAAATSDFGIQTIVNIVPRNPVRAAADLDLLAVMFFAIVFGAALTRIAPERARPMVDWLDSLSEVVNHIVTMTMRFAPLGVACLVFGVTSRFGFQALELLGWFVATVLGALLFHVVVNISVIVRLLVGMSPSLFFSRIRGAMVTGFSTSSSNATLPTALSAAEQQLGIPPQIAGFVLPLGSQLCMNGTALFEGITVLTLAQAFGVTLSGAQMVAVVVMCVVTSVGAAGVPGGSIPLLVGILTMFGIPAEGIAIVLGVDRLLDMARTTVNVASDLSATAFVARSEDVWDAASVPPLDRGVIAEATPA